MKQFFVFYSLLITLTAAMALYVAYESSRFTPEPSKQYQVRDLDQQSRKHSLDAVISKIVWVHRKIEAIRDSVRANLNRAKEFKAFGSHAQERERISRSLEEINKAIRPCPPVKDGRVKIVIDGKPIEVEVHLDNQN